MSQITRQELRLLDKCNLRPLDILWASIHQTTSWQWEDDKRSPSSFHQRDDLYRSEELAVIFLNLWTCETIKGISQDFLNASLPPVAPWMKHTLNYGERQGGWTWGQVIDACCLAGELKVATALLQSSSNLAETAGETNMYFDVFCLFHDLCKICMLNGSSCIYMHDVMICI